VSQRAQRQTNRLLGYPDDARLLIINADDLGMCHAANAAITRTLTAGVATSATLMVPCAWALHAMQWLAAHPHIPFGVHLTAVGDGLHYRWKPISRPDHVLSLVDETGHFYNWDRMAEFVARARLDELEVEFRAQIDTVLAAGLKPTHLDWHSIRIHRRPEILDVMFGLAKEYGLALRVRDRTLIDNVQRRGLPTNDYDFLDSSEFDTTTKPAQFARLLHDLPSGLSEWALHPGLGTPELQAIEPETWSARQADYEFAISTEARTIIEREGITLLSYQPLQAVWQGK
jgi:predicted glycoside hydrolase/deacetylase ChbG (UPF0249 family)